MNNLFIRADATPRMGAGHLMRCLALAQAWQAQGGEVTFITACNNATLLQRLAAEGFNRLVLAQAYPAQEDWETTSQAVAKHSDAWVVVDGYHFSPEYHQKIKETGPQLLVIDDMAHLGHYYADVVLNQNLLVEQPTYSCAPSTRLLLGPRYALLRREFWPWRGWRREIPETARKILITLGGSDPDNQTLKVLKALKQLGTGELEAVIVAGANNPHLHQLKVAAHHSPFPLRLAHNATNMPELMVWADMAVSASGSTCWELALMGLPALLLVVAENQRPLATALQSSGIALNLGTASELDAAMLKNSLKKLGEDGVLRSAMAQRGQKLVDGNGAARVVWALRQGITLRPAQKDDCFLIWEWANDPVTRAQSFSTHFIPRENHRRWFHQKLNETTTLFYIALGPENRPIGQIRYQIENTSAVVSVSVAPDSRGLGYGAAIIQSGSQEIWQTTHVDLIHAYIKSENIASLRAFEKAGFENAGMTAVEKEQAHHLLKRREP